MYYTEGVGGGGGRGGNVTVRGGGGVAARVRGRARLSIFPEEIKRAKINGKPFAKRFTS